MILDPLSDSKAIGSTDPAIWKKLADQGFSLVPCQGKKPVEKNWNDACLEKRPFCPCEYIGLNAAIACGPASGVIGLDIDDIQRFVSYANQHNLRLPVTREHQTGSGKNHKFYRYPNDGRKYGNRSIKEGGFDIRGLGGCLVAPGSVHPDTGRLYEVSMAVPIAEAPDWLLGLASQEEAKKLPSQSTGPQWGGSVDDLKIRTETKLLIKNGVPKGQRSEALFSVICSLIWFGLSDSDIHAVIRNNPIGEKYHEKGPGKDAWLQAEINRARSSRVSKEADEDGAVADIEHYLKIETYLQENEVGLAKLIAEKKRGKLRYDIKENRWYLFERHIWQKISDERVLEALEELKDELKELALRFAQRKIEASGRPDKDSVKKFCEYEKKLLTTISKMGDVSVAASIRTMCRSEGSYLGFNGPWDADHHILATPNGILNLKDLGFRNGRPDDNIRTAIPTRWEGLNEQCFLFAKTLLEIFDGNQEIVDYLQRVFGYGLSGFTKYHHLWVLEGKGRNGKSLLFKVLKHVLGDLIGLLDRELLLDRKHQRQSGQASPDVLNLRGKRMVFLIETSEGRKFDPGKLKVLTGGDLLQGRGLYAKDYSIFQNTAKIFVLTNSRPHISGSDFASWQRIVLVPFDLSFVSEPNPDPKRKERLADPDLEEALKAESSGILAWLVKGYVRAEREGLIPPDCIKSATSEYRKEEDTVGRFVEEKIESYDGGQLGMGDAYDAYKQWCESEGIKPKHNTSFGREMRNHVEVEKRGHKSFIIDVRFRS